MADKTPIRTVFNASNVATGLAEFQSGETIALTHGGTGADLSIGTAGQVLKVNSGASALEFGAVEAIVNIDNATNLTGYTLATTDQLLISDGGTEGRATFAQLDTLFSSTSKTLTNKTLTTPIIAEIDSGSTITLDATTDIVLDAGGADIILKDDGTTFGGLTNSSANLIIKSGTTTMLTGNGINAIFAGNVTVSGDLDVTGDFDMSDANLTNVGSISLDSLTGDTDANTSITFSGLDVITIATGGTTAMTIDASQNTTLAGTLTAITSIGIGSAVLTEAEMEKLDGITNGAGAANKAVVLDGNADIASGLRNITASGTLQGTTITATTAFVPDASDGAALGTTALEFSDLFLADGAVINFGANQDITLTHVADVGLTLTHTATGDNLPVVLQLKSEEDEILINEVIASLEFAAGDSDGTDGAIVAAGIHAIAEGTFSATANATKLVFTTGVSETAASSATAKMTLSSAGLLTIADDFIIKDGGTIGSASDPDAIVISSAGVVTMNQIPIFSAGINVSGGTIAGTLATVAQTAITSVGTLTALQIDNININGNAITSTAGVDLTISPLAGQQIILDGAIVIGAGSTSTAGTIKFLEGTDNGTNGVTLIGPASTADVTVTLPAVTGTIITTANSDEATTTTSTNDVDFVLVDDGGVMKKITRANLGITGNAGYTNSAFFDPPGSLGNFDCAKINEQTGSAEIGITINDIDAFGIQLAGFDSYDHLEPQFDLKTTDLGSGEAYVGA